MQDWWCERVKLVYRHVPNLAGFLVKADSEFRPGPYTYGRKPYRRREPAGAGAQALRRGGGMALLCV